MYRALDDSLLRTSVRPSSSIHPLSWAETVCLNSRISGYVEVLTVRQNYPSSHHTGHHCYLYIFERLVLRPFWIPQAHRRILWMSCFSCDLFPVLDIYYTSRTARWISFRQTAEVSRTIWRCQSHYLLREQSLLDKIKHQAANQSQAVVDIRSPNYPSPPVDSHHHSRHRRQRMWTTPAQNKKPHHCQCRPNCLYHLLLYCYLEDDQIPKALPRRPQTHRQTPRSQVARRSRCPPNLYFLHTVQQKRNQSNHSSQSSRSADRSPEFDALLRMLHLLYNHCFPLQS